MMKKLIVLAMVLGFFGATGFSQAQEVGLCKNNRTGVYSFANAAELKKDKCPTGFTFVDINQTAGIHNAAYGNIENGLLAPASNCTIQSSTAFTNYVYYLIEFAAGTFTAEPVCTASITPPDFSAAGALVPAPPLFNYSVMSATQLDIWVPIFTGTEAYFVQFICVQ
jgi:hypothetical protein